MKTKPILSILVFGTLGWFALQSVVLNQSRFLTVRNQGLTATNHSDDHICLSLNEIPIVHDKRGEDAPVLDFISQGLPSPFSDDVSAKPVLKTIKNGHFMMREPVGFGGMHTRISVWNDKEVLLNDDYLIPPPNATQFVPRHAKRVLKDGGDYFAYCNMGNWGNHPGHFKHDVLPKIAYFRSILPDTVTFIFPHIYHPVLAFVDPDFCDSRVVWIRSCFDCQEVQVTSGGTLTIPLRNGMYPVTAYHDFYNPLRTWLQTSTSIIHKQQPERKLVIYYKRIAGKKPQMGQATLGRVLNLGQEKELLRRVRDAMIRHGKARDYRLVVFDGSMEEDEEGNRVKMPLEQQYQLFRSAQTIIGPHGTGLGANLIWINPAPEDCASRVQLLEFMPGQDTIHVHPSEFTYPSHFPYTRGLAINYHALLYQPRSTIRETFIDLDMVDEFLDDVWGPESDKKEDDNDDENAADASARPSTSAASPLIQET